MHRGPSKAVMLVGALALLLAACGAPAPAAVKHHVHRSGGVSQSQSQVQNRSLSAFASFPGSVQRVDVCVPSSELEAAATSPPQVVDCWAGTLDGHALQFTLVSASGWQGYQLTVAGEAPVVRHVDANTGIPFQVYQFSGPYVCISGTGARLAIDLKTGRAFSAALGPRAARVARKHCASPKNPNLTGFVAGIPAQVAQNTFSMAPPSPVSTVSMLNASQGWLLLQDGEVCRTVDGGAVWNFVTPQAIFAATGTDAFWGAFPDAQHASLVGGAVDSQGFITSPVVYETSDGGTAWTRFPTGVSGAVESAQVLFLSNSYGYILLTYGATAGSQAVMLLRTTDGGRHWTVAANGLPQPQNPSIIFGGDKTGFGFAATGTGWITGETAATGILLYGTTDGGTNWRRQSVSLPSLDTAQATSGNAESFPPDFFGSADGVLPVAFSGPHPSADFYRTTDGGATWLPTAPVGDGLVAWSFSSPLTGFATDGLALYRTVDGGASWETIKSALGMQDSTKLDFISPTMGWAVVGGSLFRTDDGGETWTPVNIGPGPLPNG